MELSTSTRVNTIWHFVYITRILFIAEYCVTDTIPSDTTAMAFFRTRLLSKAPTRNYVTSRHQRLVPSFFYLIVVLAMFFFFCCVNMAVFYSLKWWLRWIYKVRIMCMRRADREPYIYSLIFQSDYTRCAIWFEDSRLFDVIIGYAN